MRYCVRCLYPDTKPELTFDQNGICSACINADMKEKIDWKQKRQEFIKILDKHRSKNKTNYDCIIPVSGGKDSTFQTYMIKKEFGLNPLVVNFHPDDQTDIGRKNLANLKRIGVDCVEFTPNPNVYLKLATFGLKEFGDFQWPEHIGIFTIPVQIAVRYNISLIIWGENPQFEYGGPGLGDEMNYEWLKKFGGFWLDECTVKGIATKQNIELKFLNPYVYPTKEELEQMNLRSVFLFYFLKYNVYDVLDHVKKHGFNVDDKPKEGTYTNWENLDEKYTGMHDYFKWIKYGFGRATDHASLDIRLGKISRDEGIELVKKHEGKIPDRYFDEFLNDMELDKEEFYNVVDKFANKEIFKLDENGKFLRDEDGNLEKKFWP